MIQFKNVSKTYKNGTKALSHVDLEIADGEFVFVLGASGAGKSTFLKLMMREEVPTSGEVLINGYNLNTIQKRKIPYFRRTLGIVFQDFRLIPNMRVYDNVAFAMRVIGAKEKDISKRVAYALSLVGLSSKAKAYPNQLSGGEQQRVALARALVNNADIIIADEPTGNIDPQMSYEIVDLLSHINANGSTVIMVTHAHNPVKQLPGKPIISIKNGSAISDTAKGDVPLQPAEKTEPVAEIHSNFYDMPNENAEVEKFLRDYGTSREDEDDEEELTEMRMDGSVSDDLRSDPSFASDINLKEVYNELYSDSEQTENAPDEKSDVIHSGGNAFRSKKDEGGDAQ